MNTFDIIDRMCAGRMIKGKREHGLLNLYTDNRFWPSQLEEELLDALNYCWFAKAKGHLPMATCDYITHHLKHILKIMWETS